VRVERLTAGQAFHRTVQSAFLTGLIGAWGYKERQWRLIQGGRGRVDLAVEVDGDEQMLVTIEIKGTDWDAIRRSTPRRGAVDLRAAIRASCGDRAAAGRPGSRRTPGPAPALAPSSYGPNGPWYHVAPARLRPR
jgi:hypothetical protein